MATVLEIKQSILDLSATEYAEIIEWLYEREEAEWDRQIEADAATGKLDFLKAQVAVPTETDAQRRVRANLRRPSAGRRLAPPTQADAQGRPRLSPWERPTRSVG